MNDIVPIGGFNIRSDRVYAIVQEIHNTQARICNDFMQIGKLLVEVQEDRLHGDWASHCLTFDDFITDIGMKKTSAYNSIKVWRQFGHLDTTGIPMDRLVTLAPLRLTTDDQKQEWLEKARELPSRGLRDEIRERRGDIPIDVCEHYKQVILHKCQECGLVSDRPLS